MDAQQIARLLKENCRAFGSGVAHVYLLLGCYLVYFDDESHISIDAETLRLRPQSPCGPLTRKNANMCFRALDWLRQHTHPDKF